ncbi:MAG: acyl carrier protein [bacterium]
MTVPTDLNEATVTDIVCRRLKEIAPETDPWSLDPNEDVRETLDIDSFDFLNFLISLNEDVGVEIPEKDYGMLSSRSDIVNYLLAHAPR